MAAAKIVGLVVTPTTCFSLTRSARLPVSIRSRERSSSQMDTPASARAWSRSLIGSLLRGGLFGCCVDAVLGGLRDRLGGDAELRVDPLVRRGGAPVLEADHPSGVADVLPPAEAQAGLDAHPRTDGSRQHLVAVGLGLLLEPLHRRHGDDAGVDAV